MPVVTRLAALLGKTSAPTAPAASLAEGALVKLIVSRDRIPDPPRVHPKGYIHVSGLVRGDCPRFLALQRRFQKFYDNQVNGAVRIMWEIGRAVEKHVRAQLIASLPPLQVYGQWQCPCHDPKKGVKGRVREGFAVDNGKCVRCGHHAMIYVELDLECDIYCVTGHPDFILILDGRIYPVEIKSLTNSASANKKGEGFDTIEKPFVNHELQVSSYHRMLVPLARRLGLPLGECAIIFYTSKDFNGFKAPYPYKEFHADPFKHKIAIQRMFDEAKAAYEGVTGMLPPRLNACSNAGTACASGCPLVHQCFALTDGLTVKGTPTVKRLRE